MCTVQLPESGVQCDLPLDRYDALAAFKIFCSKASTIAVPIVMKKVTHMVLDFDDKIMTSPTKLLCHMCHESLAKETLKSYILSGLNSPLELLAAD